MQNGKWEIIKKEFKLNRIVVISGIGVRKYWRNLNYRLKATYGKENMNREYVKKIGEYFC